MSWVTPMAAESVDVRLARLEGSYAEVSERLGAIEQRLVGSLENRLEQRFASLEAKIEGKFARSDARMDRLESKMDRQFTCVVGLIAISLLIPIALRFLPTP